METYVYPDGIEQETEVVVNVYVDYPDQDSFYQDYPHPSGDTIENIENNYTINNEFENNFYFGGGSGPSLAQAVFQALLLPPAITAGAAAIDVARAYAQAQLTAAGSNALLTGASAIHEATSALVLEGSAAAGEYGLGFALGLAADASVCGIAALLGYKISETIVTETGAADTWSELLLEADPWKLKTPGSLMGKILGIQYGDKTYIDSRLYNAIKSKLDEWISYPYIERFEKDGVEYEIGASEVANSLTVRSTISYECRQGDITGSGGKWFTAEISGVDVRVLYFWRYNPDSPIGLYGTLFGILAVSKSGYPVINRTNYGTLGYESENNAGYSISDSGTRNSYYWRTYEMQTNAIHNGAIMLYNNPNPEPIPFDPLLLIDYMDSIVENPKMKGIEPWSGDIVEDPTSGAIQVVINVTTKQTVPYYPMSFPSAPYSFPTYNPTTQPNPTTVYDPRTQIQPYAVPWPQQNPTSDPSSNPSSPTIIPVPIILPSTQPGKDNGETPEIEAPVIAPPFDLSYSYGGLYNVYNPTAQQLYEFGRFLWVSWTDATLSKIINNPFDGVISLHEIYTAPNRDQTKVITSGFLASAVSAATVTNRYSEIDCGTIVIPEYFNNYLDYTPYTSAYAYLPFIGIVELNADDIVGHAVNIKYGVDSYSGACVAFIIVARSDGLDENYSEAVYQFEGNCAVQLPISGGSQAAITAGLWQTGSKAIGNTLLNIIGGSEAGALNGATSLISGVSNTLLTRKSEVQHSGTMSSNFGAMAGKKPYIIVKRPRQVVVTNYNLDYGYPAHAMVTIGQCQGYLRVREVNVVSATATDEEKQEIESLLKAGVYVS